MNHVGIEIILVGSSLGRCTGRGSRGSLCSFFSLLSVPLALLLPPLKLAIKSVGVRLLALTQPNSPLGDHLARHWVLVCLCSVTSISHGCV